MKTRLPLVLLAMLAAACSSKGSDDVAAAGTEELNEGHDAWGPALSLRDDTARFDGRPAGGWYVTPVHATLLPSGKVLVSGWGRAQADRCAFPEGSRAHGETFVLDPAALAGANAPADMGVVSIDEHPDETPGWTNGVLYCAGHIPLNGGVLYTGGARYQSLGVRGLEAEVGLSSARVFDPASGRDAEAGGVDAGWSPSGDDQESARARSHRQARLALVPDEHQAR